MPKQLRRVASPDPVITQLQQAITEWTDRICSVEVIDSVVLPGIDVGGPSSDTTVYHTLGRPVRYWTVLSPEMGGLVYASPSVNPLPERQLLLRSTAPVRCALMVF